MCQRFAGRLRSVVASGAGARCAFETATSVAGIACGTRVTANEGEARASVIEAACRLLRAHGRTRG